MRINRSIIGFLLGIIMPVLGFLIVFFVMRAGNTFSTFVTNLSAQHGLLSKVISLSILANLIPFIFFNSRRLDEASKGVFIATMLFAVIIVLLRFVWS